MDREKFLGVGVGGREIYPPQPDIKYKEQYNQWVKGVREIDLDREKDNYTIGSSKIEGMGWYARRDIKRGEVISNYLVGPYEDLRTADEIEEGSNFDKSAVQVGITPEGEAIYIGVSNHPRKYINHSCEPNIGIRRLSLPEGGWRSELVAVREIKAGEEITLDYSTTQLEKWQMECRCGTKSCRHNITDFARLAPDLQDKYIKLGIIPDWMIKAVRGDQKI